MPFSTTGFVSTAALPRARDMTRNRRKTEIRCPGRPGPKDHLKPFPYAAKVCSDVATEEQLTTLRNHANNRPAYRFRTLDNQIDGKRDHSHLDGWELSDDRDLDSGNRRSYGRKWSQGEKTARKEFWDVMQAVFREAGLPSDVKFLNGAGATSPEFFETYWVKRPTILRTLLGAEDQGGHGDLSRHDWLWEKKKGLQLSWPSHGGGPPHVDLQNVWADPVIAESTIVAFT